MIKNLEMYPFDVRNGKKIKKLKGRKEKGWT